MRSSHFILLLLECSRNQARALLETASEQQVVMICRLLLNLRENIVMLAQESRRIVEKNKKLIERLSRKSTKEKTKYSLIRRFWSTVYNLIKSAKRVLIRVLK